MTTNTIEIANPAFCVALYEMEKLIKEGYSLSEQHVPIYIAGLYRIELVKAEYKAERSHTVAYLDENGTSMIRNATGDEIGEVETAKHPPVEEKPAAPKRGPKPKAK